MNVIDHLSYSSVTSYLLCPKSWRYKYLDREVTFRSPALVYGSAVHNTVEAYLTDKSLDLPDLWEKHFEEQIQGGDLILWNYETPEEYLNQGLMLFTEPEIVLELEKITPMVKNKEVQIEKRIELRVPGVDVPVIGYIDVITADGVPGDFKTSSKSWSQSQAENETQSLFYLAALQQAGHKIDNYWTFRHFIFVKTKKPKFQMFEHFHNPGQVMWLFNMIRNVWQGIQADVFPENPTGWKCSDKYCDFWLLCRGRY